MGKIWVEVSLISARGLRRASLWKNQWFAVGWIDPKNKYCTKIDASGSSNPQWRTKFATLIDSSGSGFGDLALHIEVYSREPIFLRESLHGTATIFLKEFLLKHSKDDSVSTKAIEEVGSFQLRKGNSSKPQGFIDVSVRISEEGEVPSSYFGNGGGIMLVDHNDSIVSAKEEDSFADSPHEPLTRLPINPRARGNRTHTEFPHGFAKEENSFAGSPHEPPARLPIVTRARGNRPHIEFPHGSAEEEDLLADSPHEPPARLPIVTRARGNQAHTEFPHSFAKEEHSLANSPHEPPARHPIVTRARGNRTQTEFPHGAPRTNTDSSSGGPGGMTYHPPGGHLPSYRSVQTPPPPPPPSNVGLVPTFLPRTANPQLGANYVNMPPSGGSHGQSRRPAAFEMGLGAGALAAGAMIFGDDFMSGYDIPAGFQET